MVEMNDLGLKIPERRLEATAEKRVGTVGQARVFSAVDTMVGGEPPKILPSQPLPPVMPNVGEVEDPDLVSPAQLS
jgi:hypothetical protein